MTNREQPGHFEREPSYETIFPLDIDVLTNRLQAFESSSEDFVQMVTELRGKWGQASSLYANMPFDDLILWHQEEDDFHPEAALYYRAGLLYGMDVAKATRLQNPMTSTLKADNPQAFTAALSYMKDTYRGLPDDERTGWRRQKVREERYTGSDMLSIAAATQHDSLARRFDADTSAEENTLALHVGMVDGAIFVDAYNAFRDERQPEMFDDPVVYAASVSRHHAIIIGGQDFLDNTVELNKADDIKRAIETLGYFRDNATLDAAMFEYGVRPNVGLRIVQSGSNDFHFAAELGGFELRGFSRCMIAKTSILAAGLGEVGDVVTSANSHGILAATIGLAAGALMMLRNFDSKKLMEEQATRYRVPCSDTSNEKRIKKSPTSIQRKLVHMLAYASGLNMGWGEDDPGRGRFVDVDAIIEIDPED